MSYLDKARLECGEVHVSTHRRTFSGTVVLREDSTNAYILIPVSFAYSFARRITRSSILTVRALMAMQSSLHKKNLLANDFSVR